MSEETSSPQAPSNAPSAQEETNGATPVNADAVIENPKNFLSAHERVKAENKDLKAALSELQGKLGVIEASLGTLDATTAIQIQQKIQESERLKAEQETFRRTLIAETESTLKSQYEPQIKTLEQSNIALTNTMASILEQQALSAAFSRNNGSDFQAFAALMSSRLKAEFFDVQDPASPTGMRKELRRFTRIDGSTLTDAQGVELSVQQVFRAANAGDYGSPMKATFNEFNQSTGDGFYQGSTGSDIQNPWSKAHWNLTAQGKIAKQNLSLARQMAAQAGKSLK